MSGKCELVKRWRPIAISDEIYEVIDKYYKDHEEELKIKYGVRSRTAFVNWCLREYFKEKGII